MSGALLDHSLVQALHHGQSVIVPTPQRATRVRHAWSRLRMAQGDEVWESPDILTWDSWLAREWQRGMDRTGGAGGAGEQRLNRAQERQLWNEALASLENQFQEDTPLRAHATALMRAASRARQGMMSPPRQPLTEEERLLWLALARVDSLGRKGGWRSIALATPDELPLQCEPPLIAGESPESALQLELSRKLWGGRSLLAGVDTVNAIAPHCMRASSPAEEIHAVACWCLAQLEADASRRLLVISASATPLPQLAAELRRALTAGTQASLSTEPDPRLLSVEGGEPLLQHALIADAIEALACLREPVELASFGRLLLSPYLAVAGDHGPALELALRDLGRARLSVADLLRALQHLATRIPEAAAVADRLAQFRLALDPGRRRGATEWAVHFDRALRLLGFPGERTLDSRDAQRLMRWRELLDELASLDALGLQMDFEDAWEQLLQLARHGVHEAAGTDAAITLTADRGDPLVRHDGIWVLGLTESAWPEPPRPDAFVSLSEQKRAGWPEASVEARMKQASEELAGWQRRTDQLHLSHAAFEGDLHHRPSRLLRNEHWEDFDTSARPDVGVIASQPLEETRDETLPPQVVRPTALNAGLRSLQLQQDCPFRAQAELRLGAKPLESPSDSIDPRLRGQLLHKALELLWRELKDSAALSALGSGAREALVLRSWRGAEVQILDRLVVPLDARVRARERRRGEQVLASLLVLESGRAPFAVVGIEERAEASVGGVDIRLRLDRIDRLEEGSELLIDYKASRLQSIALDDVEPRPLQLAVYAAARAAAGAPVQAVALQSLAPGHLKLSGLGAASAASASGLRATEDWNADVARWAIEIERLARTFLAGDARVAPAAGVCRTCHLPAFCRIAVEEADDE